MLPNNLDIFANKNCWQDLFIISQFGYTAVIQGVTFFAIKSEFFAGVFWSIRHFLNIFVRQIDADRCGSRAETPFAGMGATFSRKITNREISKQFSSSKAKVLVLNWPSPTPFVYFRSFQQFLQKNRRLQWDSNLDHRSRWQARWTLDHLHSPKLKACLH